MTAEKKEQIFIVTTVAVLLVGGWGYGISQFFWKRPSANPPMPPPRTVVGTPNPSGVGSPTARGVPAAPYVPTDPNWRAKFDKVYTLADNEVLKRIPPSAFIPEREPYYMTGGGRGARAATSVQVPSYMILRWDSGQLGLSGGSTSTSPRRLALILQSPLGLRPADMDIPADMLSLELPGDWIVRSTATTAQKLEALGPILSSASSKKVRFEQQQVDREVVVVSGKYTFKPLEGNADNTTVHLYTDALDPAGTDAQINRAPTSTLINLVMSLAGTTQVVSEVEGVTLTGATAAPPTTSGSLIPFRIHSSANAILRAPTGPERDVLIQKLFSNVSAQTGLQFTKAQRKVDLWKLVEVPG